MPTYKFKCNDCQLIEQYNMTISLYLKNKDQYQECSECGGKLTQQVKAINSKMIKDKMTVIEEAKEDARKIVQKMEDGDQKVIQDIYGDDVNKLKNR